MVVNPSMRAEGEGGTDGAPPAIRRAPGLSAEGLSEPRTALQRSHAGTEGHNDGLVRARAPDSRAQPRGPSPLSSSPSPRGRPSARRQPLWLAVLPGGRGGACTGSLGSDHLGLPAGPDVRGRCAALRGAPHAAATQKATAPLRAAGEWGGGGTRSSAGAPPAPPREGARGAPGFPRGRAGATPSQLHGGAGLTLRVGRGCGNASGSGGLRRAGHAAKEGGGMGAERLLEEPGLGGDGGGSEPPALSARPTGAGGRERGTVPRKGRGSSFKASPGASFGSDAGSVRAGQRGRMGTGPGRGEGYGRWKVAFRAPGLLPAKGAALSTQSWVHACTCMSAYACTRTHPPGKRTEVRWEPRCRQWAPLSH